MKKDVKCLLSALVFAGISWGGYGIASAAGEAVYELNPVVVTATRTEKADIDVPANVTVVTAKKIEEAGYKNAFDAIQSQVGVESTGYGDAGQDFGFSSGTHGRAWIRSWYVGHGQWHPDEFEKLQFTGRYPERYDRED